MSALGVGGESVVNVCSLLAIPGLNDPSSDISGICRQKLYPSTGYGSTWVNGGGYQLEGGGI